MASNEEGSIAVEMGFCGIVFGLLVTGLIGFGSLFSQELTDDLKDVRALLDELG